MLQESLRIALVAPSFFEVPPKSYGGIEVVVALLADGLVERGHDVTLLGAGRDRTNARFIPTYQEPQGHRIGDPMPELVHAARVTELLDDLDIDIVHDHTMAGPLLAPARKVPTVVTAHGPVLGDWRDYLTAVSRRISLVAISEAQRRLAPELPWRATVHNALDVNAYPYREAKDEYVLFLGRMSPDKAAHVAIDIARAVDKRIIVAGKCVEPGEARYFAEQVEPRLGSDTEWIGEVGGQDKTNLLASAECLLFPIQWDEPFGVVMLEAMACGTPVVASRRGAVPEVVAEGVTGFVRDTPEEMAAALAEIKRIHPEDCRRRVVENFRPELMVEAYERVFVDLAS